MDVQQESNTLHDQLSCTRNTPGLTTSGLIPNLSDNATEECECNIELSLKNGRTLAVVQHPPFKANKPVGPSQDRDRGALWSSAFTAPTFEYLKNSINLASV